jgi:hypothetical protein
LKRKNREVAQLSKETIREIETKNIEKPKSILKMPIAKAHGILGHINEVKTREICEHLKINITCGSLKTCEACAIAKAKRESYESK